MEIKVLESKKDKLKFELVDEDHTFCNFIRKELWEDSHTKSASYKIEHTLISEPMILVETDGKEKPKDSLLKTTARLIKKIKDLREQAKKELK